jgi:hypothetical protein
MVAATVPAFFDYLRYNAGMHFLSDNVDGYLIGTGILVPQLHKNRKIKNVNNTAQSVAFGNQVISLTWHF